MSSTRTSGGRRQALIGTFRYGSLSCTCASTRGRPSILAASSCRVMDKIAVLCKIGTRGTNWQRHRCIIWKIEDYLDVATIIASSLRHMAGRECTGASFLLDDRWPPLTMGHEHEYWTYVPIKPGKILARAWLRGC